MPRGRRTPRGMKRLSKYLEQFLQWSRARAKRTIGIAITETTALDG